MPFNLKNNRGSRCYSYTVECDIVTRGENTKGKLGSYMMPHVLQARASYNLRQSTPSYRVLFDLDTGESSSLRTIDLFATTTDWSPTCVGTRSV